MSREMTRYVLHLTSFTHVSCTTTYIVVGRQWLASGVNTRWWKLTVRDDWWPKAARHSNAPRPRTIYSDWHYNIQNKTLWTASLNMHTDYSSHIPSKKPVRTAASAQQRNGNHWTFCRLHLRFLYICLVVENKRAHSVSRPCAIT